MRENLDALRRSAISLLYLTYEIQDGTLNSDTAAQTISAVCFRIREQAHLIQKALKDA